MSDEMTEGSLFMQFLTKIANRSEEEIRKVIYTEEGKIHENAFENLVAMDAARVSKLKGSTQEVFQNGYKKAKSEVGSEFEKTFREVTGYDADAENFAELAQKYHAEMLEKSKAKKSEPPTWEQVKTLPEFLKWEKERVPKSKYDELHAEHTNFKTQVERDRTFQQVDKLAFDALEKMLPDFDRYKDSPNVLHTLKNAFRESIRGYNYQPDGNGSYIVMNDKGERAQDAHGNPLTIDDVVKKNAPNFFSFLKQPPKGGAGNKQEDGGNQTGDEIVITTTRQYNQLMAPLMNLFDAESEKKKLALFNAYKKAKEANKLQD